MDSGRPVLRGAATNGDPFEEALHAAAFVPEEREEFARVEVGGIVAEKSFEAPLNVGGAPGAQAVAFRNDPVVAQRVQHGRGPGWRALPGSEDDRIAARRGAKERRPS